MKGTMALRASLASALLAMAALAVLGASPALAASTAPPMIESVSVSHITEHDATLNARIDPNGLDTSYRFRLESGCLPPLACAAITVYPLPSGQIPASYEIHRVTLDLNHAGVTLQPATKYRYSVEATNSDGTTQGPDQTFTTPPGTQEPLIEGESVSNITPTDATLEVEIYPGGLETTYEVWLGTIGCIEANLAATCEETQIAGAIPAGFSTQTVSIDIAKAWHDLSPSTHYVYSARASNSAGTAYGNSAFFQTPPASAPVIEGESVSHITPTDATLEAQINTAGLETTYEFHLLEAWWCEELTPPCEPPIRLFTLPSGKLLGSFVTQSVSLDLNSAGVTLSPGHDFYEYWVTATNAAGTAEGQPKRFVTPTEPPPEPEPRVESEPLPPDQPSGSTSVESSPTLEGASSLSSHRRKHHRRTHKRRHHRRPGFISRD